MRGSIKFLIACVIAGLFFQVHHMIVVWNTLSLEQRLDIVYPLGALGVIYTAITGAILAASYHENRQHYEAMKWFCPVYWVLLTCQYVIKFLDKIFD